MTPNEIQIQVETGRVLPSKSAGDCARCFADGYLVERCVLLRALPPPFPLPTEPYPLPRSDQMEGILCVYCGTFEPAPGRHYSAAQPLTWPLPERRKVGKIRDFTAGQRTHDGGNKDAHGRSEELTSRMMNDPNDADVKLERLWESISNHQAAERVAMTHALRRQTRQIVLAVAAVGAALCVTIGGSVLAFILTR